MFRALLNVALALVVVDALTSFFMSPSQFPRSVTKAILDPIYAPIRAVHPDLGGIDLSPLAALAVIHLLGRLTRPKPSS
jgi:YggT family protein